MREIVLILLGVTLLLSLGYLLTHPMPSGQVEMLRHLIAGDRKLSPPRGKKRDWRLHAFERAPRPGDADIPAGAHVHVETDQGVFVIELFPEAAPNTVANFKALVSRGFYDGLSFYRLIPGLAIQGGDPKGDGTGGPGYRIVDEINEHKHINGAVAMVRGPDPDSAGSRFYICFGSHPRLDGYDTVFGQVVEGMEVVERMHAGTVMKKLRVLP